MTLRRSHLASLLLALFVVGGFVLPVLHRAQHAAQHADAAVVAAPADSAAPADGATPAEAAQADAPAWAADAAGHLHDCDLCAVQWHVRLALASSAPAPTFADADLASRVASFVAHVGAAARLIRGPPLAA